MTEYCPSLPSSTDALRAVNGDPVGWALVARDILFRAGLIAGGMYLYDRDTDKIWHRAIAGSASIELFVLSWIWLSKQNHRPASP